MKIKLLFIISIFCICKSYSQQIPPAKIIFKPVFGQLPLVLDNKSYLLGKSDSIEFETLKFYISDIQFLNNGKVAFTEDKSFHLINAAVDSSMLLSINFNSKMVFNEIKFNLGIDSITNVSGAMGGDLDPTKGMYWTWQSGYINFKLEGNSSACPLRKNEFQFHLGGYQFPYNTLQTIQLKVKTNEPIKIYLDIKKYFEAISLTSQNRVMSPNQDALKLSALIAKCFYTK